MPKAPKSTMHNWKHFPERYIPRQQLLKAKLQMLRSQARRKGRGMTAGGKKRITQPAPVVTPPPETPEQTETPPAEASKM